MKPSSVAFLNHASNYAQLTSQCYALSNYGSSSSPSAHNHSSFSNLYDSYSQECPYSVHQLKTKTVLFFNLLTSRISVVQSLLDAFSNLTLLVDNTTSFMISYVNNRKSFLSAVEVSTPEKLTDGFLN